MAQVTGGARGLAPKRYLEEPRFLNDLKPLFWRNQKERNVQIRLHRDEVGHPEEPRVY